MNIITKEQEEKLRILLHKPAINITPEDAKFILVLMSLDGVRFREIVDEEIDRQDGNKHKTKQD